MAYNSNNPVYLWVDWKIKASANLLSEQSSCSIMHALCIFQGKQSLLLIKAQLGWITYGASY